MEQNTVVGKTSFLSSLTKREKNSEYELKIEVVFPDTAMLFDS
jgi:hypothetical protein